MQHPLDEMKAYVGFSKADAAFLSALWPVVQPKLEPLLDIFYWRVMSAPATRSLVADEAQLARLRATFRVWAQELMLGPHDHAYHDRRAKIGQVHVDVGLPATYVFTAMSVFKTELCTIVREALPPEHVGPTCDAIDRITSIDLAIMTKTYISGRERLQLDALQEVLVRHLPVCVMLVDEHDRVIAATPAVEALATGDLSQRHFTEVLPPALVAAASLPELVDEALLTQRQILVNRVDAEIDGVLRSFRVAVVPLDHPRARLLLHLEDLTDVVQTEGRLRQSEALAQLGSLSAAVAHELRNPLAGISGAVQVIAGTMASDDPRRGIMDKVDAQIRRLNELVTDLLSFARPGAARLTTVDLAAVSESVLDLCDQQSGVSFRVEGQGTAHADTNLVHQVLLNLVQNAAQAQAGQGEVLLSVSPGRVLVSDAGPGVPSELRAEIFKPFMTTRTRGTGLGLAISQRAAKVMKAEVRLLPAGPLAGANFALLLQPAVSNGDAHA